jgi:hypothetical protein
MDPLRHFRIRRTYSTCYLGYDSISLRAKYNWALTMRSDDGAKHALDEQMLKSIVKQSKIFSVIRPYMRRSRRKRRWAEEVQPGHFYSPVPDLREVRSRENSIFASSSDSLPGIDLNEANQLKLLNQFRAYYSDIPFTDTPTGSTRYYYRNGYFSYLDAVVLYGMMRVLNPRKIVEVGSGFSSAVMLDTSERFFDRSIKFTFIEPDPQRLISLMREEDRSACEIISRPVQDVEIDCFRDLGEGDILFVDSSHVSKVGSDLNRLIFDVLPEIRSGVYIHFHDIFYPFEYPPEWVYAGVAFNEAYILRAFLQYNKEFRIVCFNSYLKTVHKDKLLDALPIAAEDPPADAMDKTAPAGSIWLVRS